MVKQFVPGTTRLPIDSYLRQENTTWCSMREFQLSTGFCMTFKRKRQKSICQWTNWKQKPNGTNSVHFQLSLDRIGLHCTQRLYQNSNAAIHPATVVQDLIEKIERGELTSTLGGNQIEGKVTTTMGFFGAMYFFV